MFDFIKCCCDTQEPKLTHSNTEQHFLLLPFSYKQIRTPCCSFLFIVCIFSSGEAFPTTTTTITTTNTNDTNNETNQTNDNYTNKQTHS